MPFPRPASPRLLLADLRALVKEGGRHKLIAAGLAIIIPAILIFGFWYDAKNAAVQRPQLIYVESWPVDRSDEEIKARQAVDKAARDKAQAERQEAFKRLQDRLGIE